MPPPYSTTAVLGVTLEDAVKQFTESLRRAEKDRKSDAHVQITKTEWLQSMSRSSVAALMRLPIEFAMAWAAKQDWPLTFSEAAGCEIAWYQQLIQWRDAAK